MRMVLDRRLSVTSRRLMAVVAVLICATTSLLWTKPEFKSEEVGISMVHREAVGDIVPAPLLPRNNRVTARIPPSVPQPTFVASRQKLLEAVQTHPVAVTNCALLFNGDANEIQLAKEYQKQHPKVIVEDASYVESARDCATFRRERGYISSSLTEEERDFPLAYSIVMYKNVEQTERLLRAIYRPQNYYCIHVDAKSAPEVQDGVRAIVSCFDNVMVSSKSTKVAWGTFSVLEADLFCMEDLLKMSSKWKYFINLTGQEWPLKTNLQLVRVLQAVNGANLIIGTVKGSDPTRYKWYHGGRLRPPPPDNVTLCKGPVHVFATRGYVDFIFQPKGQAFLEWIKGTTIPDESFFASLNHSPDYGVPGAYRGEPEMGETYPNWARFKIWAATWLKKVHGCKGQIVHSICVYGVGDLPNLRFDHRPELFLNKIHLEGHNPLVLDCLEEYTANVTRREISGSVHFSTANYSSYEVAWNHNPS